VAEVSLRFWKYAEGYYRLPGGSRSGELDHFQYALKPLVDLYGHTLAAEFGPLKLKAIRQRMIDTVAYHVRYTDDNPGEVWVHENRLTTATGAQVEEVRKELYPDGTKGLDQGEVLRAVFLHLKRRDSDDKVGR
jgi:hypothetical protein